MRYVPVVSIGVLLLLTYHLYGYAYFSTDDFNNLYWAQKQNAYQTLVQFLNPISRAYRPSGMTFYWILLQLFDLNAAPYHWVAWLLHAINTWLVYLILKGPGGRPGATVGAMLFACQAAFADIYWNFGSIFELLCALGFFAGILLWINREGSWKTTLVCGMVFLFALKAKEMAITLPVIWILCDLLLRNNRDVLRTLHALVPAAFGIWYGLRKSQELGSTTPDGLFYMDVSWITLGRGLGVFFNSLFGANLRWQHWIIGFVFLFLILAFRKNRPAMFFQAYFLVTILPVIFLVNHRELYLLYIPFLGLCGQIGRAHVELQSQS